MNVTILAEKDLVEALKRYFSYTAATADGSIVFVEKEDNPDIVIVEVCYSGKEQNEIKDWNEIYSGFKWAYAQLVKQLQATGSTKPILFLSHDEGLEVIDLLESLQILTNDIKIRPPKKFQHWDEKLGENIPELFVKVPRKISDLMKKFRLTQSQKPKIVESHFDFLASVLRNFTEVRRPHGILMRRSDSAKEIFLRNIPWNVLVIDNDLIDGEPIDLLLNKVIAYPYFEFWLGGHEHLKFRVIPYYPKELLDKDTPDFERRKKFNQRLKNELYDKDVSIVLLDVSLKKEYAGFYLVEDVRRQLSELDRDWVPVIMFSKYRETEYVVTSIIRGANWYSSKLEEEPSWVGALSDLVRTIYTPWLWLEEYKEKYLVNCEGDVVSKLRERKVGRIPHSTFLLHDPFFGKEPQNTFQHIVAHCLEEESADQNNIMVNLDKLREYHYIFRRLFTSFDRIEILRRATGGFSGTNVFFVRPYRATHAGNDLEYSVQLVKIGPSDEIGKEKTNFEEWINGMLDSFIGRIKVGPVKADKYSGLLYVAVGMKKDYEGRFPITLKELIELVLEDDKVHGETFVWEDVQHFVTEMFTKVLVALYGEPKGSAGAKRRTRLTKIISSYIDDLPSSLSGNIVAINLDASEANTLIESPDDNDLFEVRLEEPWINLSSPQKMKALRIHSLLQLVKLRVDLPVLLHDFEIYEVDRTNGHEKYKLKLKVRNRPYHFNECLSRQGDDHKGTSVYEDLLSDANRSIDLRVDLEADQIVALSTKEPKDRDNQLQQLQDPRIAIGKRITIVADNVKRIWENQRIKFLKEEKGARTTLRRAAEEAILEFLKTKMGDEGKVSSNPYWLLDKYRELLETFFPDRKAEFTISNTHGDLNLENVLVTRTEKKLLGWFIDFRRSRLGHTAHDFVKLETEIKTQVLSRYLGKCITTMEQNGIPKAVAIEKWLLWYYEFEMTRNSENRHKQDLHASEMFPSQWDKIKNITGLILLIRDIAADYGLGDEYNWGLFLYSFSALKFPNLDKGTEAPAPPPIPKCLAYVAACSALRKLEDADSSLQNYNRAKTIIDKKTRGEVLSEPEIDGLIKMYHNDLIGDALMRFFFEKDLNAQEQVWLTKAITNSKARGETLSQSVINSLIKMYHENLMTDELMEGFLVKAKEKSLHTQETVWLTEAITKSGAKISWKGTKVEKKLKVDVPSTGGVGNKTPIIVPAIVAAAGVIVPKMSSRGSFAGTIDILESIGYNAKLSIKEFVHIVETVGVSNICQTDELAPVDERLMKLRRKTATMNQASLVVSSILSKKLATGCNRLVIDVKAGRDSKFGTLGQSIEGARLFVEVGKHLGLKIVCVVTDNDQPQGSHVGNSLSWVEILDVLKGGGPRNQREICLFVAAQMLLLAEKAKDLDGAKRIAVDMIESGKALDRLREQLLAHKAKMEMLDNPSLLTSAEHKIQVRSTQQGYISAIDVKAVKTCAERVILKGDTIAHYNTGIILRKQVGDFAEHNEALAEIHSNDNFGDILTQQLREAFTFSDTKPPLRSPILAVVEEGKVTRF